MPCLSWFIISHLLRFPKEKDEQYWDYKFDRHHHKLWMIKFIDNHVHKPSPISNDIQWQYITPGSYVTVDKSYNGPSLSTIPDTYFYHFYIQEFHFNSTFHIYNKSAGPLNHLVGGGMYSSHCWDHGVHSTDISTPADLVVTVLSPILTPWVLYDPERLLLEPNRSKTGRTVPHKKHSMIQVLTTYVWAWNSSNVCLHKYCIDTHCKGKAM